MLREGRVAEGTKIVFNVREKKVDLGNMKYQKPKKSVMNEIDLLFQGTDGQLHAVEVTASSSALATKIGKRGIGYLEAMKAWESPGERVASIMIDKPDDLHLLLRPNSLKQSVMAAVVRTNIKLEVVGLPATFPEWSELYQQAMAALGKYSGPLDKHAFLNQWLQETFFNAPR